MLARHRHRQILEMLEATGTVRVTELAKALDVAEETIRRDLLKLDEEGQLVRTHGGAVMRESRRAELPFDVRSQRSLAEKKAIALKAAEMVHEGDVILADCSTTVLEMMQVLPNKSVLLVTNSLLIGRMVADRPRIKVVVTGGEVDSSSWSLTGLVTMEAIRRFNISRFFFSCRGIDFERGLSEATEAHAALKQIGLETAEHAYLLADHTKFGLRSSVFFGKVNQLGTIITDSNITPGDIKDLGRCGCEVVIAEAETQEVELLQEP